MPESLQAWNNKHLFSVRTSGDSAACSMHALLGSPQAGSLKCENAREIIVHAFEIAYETEEMRPSVERLLNGWWGELSAALKQRVENDGTVGKFWSTFTEPVKRTLRSAAVADQKQKIGIETARRERLKEACKVFFTEDVEAAVVRPIAVKLGLIS